MNELTPEAPQASLKKPLFTLFLVVATELIGFGLIIPILPQLASQFSVKPFWVGVLLSAYSFAQFISAPLWGGLSDKIGRKPVLIISKFGSFAAYILMAFSHSYVWFFVARLLDGFTGGNISAARAYVADITTPENRPKGMAVIGIAFGTGFILGPALGGYLYGLGQGHTPAAITAGSLSFLALLFTVFLLKEPEKLTPSSGRSWQGFLDVFHSPVLRFLFGIQLVYMIVFAGFETTFSVFTHHVLNFTPQQNSLLFMYAGIMGLFVQGFIARRSVKNLAMMIVFGFLTAAISFFVLAQTHSVAWLLSTLFIFSIGIGIINSYLPSFVSVVVNHSHEGKAMGVYESIGSVGRVLGPMIAYLPLVASLPFLYCVYAGALGVSGFLLLWFRKQS
jgi:DHA1 family tetracycline resistance protein-like MFS transporter